MLSEKTGKQSTLQMIRQRKNQNEEVEEYKKLNKTINKHIRKNLRTYKTKIIIITLKLAKDWGTSQVKNVKQQ